MGKHNKKRNIGLIHEQLVQYASRTIVEGSTQKAHKAIDIITDHFKKGSELLREFKLFSSLIHTRVDSRNIAEKIVIESKRAAQHHNANNLRIEKSALLKDINYNLSKDNFFHQRVKDYRIFATVQTLLNEWRGANKLTPAQYVEYEEVLITHLLSDKKEENLTIRENANPFVLKMMFSKFNDKYKASFTKEQRDILSSYALNKKEDVLKFMQEAKQDVTNLLKEFYEKNENDYLRDKRILVEEKIQDFTPIYSDEGITKTLMLLNLKKELSE